MTIIVQSFEFLPEIMKYCIEKEMTDEKGILKDVNTFIPIRYQEAVVDEPVIWMSQHPSRADRQADISQTMDLITPFEFDCAVYERDLEDAEKASQNLTMRVIAAIRLNYLEAQKEIVGGRIIRRIGLETYTPVGEVQINGKSDRLPATGVILNIVHTINWDVCCKKLKGDD